MIHNDEHWQQCCGSPHRRGARSDGGRGPSLLLITDFAIRGLSVGLSNSRYSSTMSSEKPDRDGKADDPQGAPDTERKQGQEKAGKKEDELKGAGGEAEKSDKKRKPSGAPWYKRPVIFGVLVLVAIVATIGIILGVRHSRSHVTTDDAYVDGVSEIVSPQVAARVVRVLVTDNQDVSAGQELVDLDPSDYQARLDQAEASLEQARAQLSEAAAQKVVFEAQVQQAQASLGTAQANATNATNQWDRYQRLKRVNAAAVSDQQMDSAQAAQTSAAAQLEAAQKSVGAAQAQVGYADSLITAAKAGIGSGDSQVAQAKLTLSYTRVVARTAGRVANKTVAEGNVVGLGVPLMAIVPRYVYVTANLKETQLAHIRRGQPVAIKVDAYPDMKLTGKVDSVEPASGQTFSALPAQNATGNWVKVVQRVPVKIVFDQIPDDPGRRLAPGMSVEISAKVR
jgi:membrane fusion protein (multidrug efflux system)